MSACRLTAYAGVTSTPHKGVTQATFNIFDDPNPTQVMEWFSKAILPLVGEDAANIVKQALEGDANRKESFTAAVLKFRPPCNEPAR